MEANAPALLVTDLDELDFAGAVARLSNMRDVLMRSEEEPGNGNVRRLAYRNRPGEPESHLQFSDLSDRFAVHVDPTAALSASSFAETNVRSDGPPDTMDQALARIDRWLAILELPRARHWGRMNPADDPNEAHARFAGTLLCEFNPDAANAFLRVPVPSPYRTVGQIAVDRRPCFDRRISDAITGAIPTTVRLSAEETGHAYLLETPHDMTIRCEPAADPMERLRIHAWLARFAHVRQPLLKGGRDAGRANP